VVVADVLQGGSHAFDEVVVLDRGGHGAGWGSGAKGQGPSEPAILAGPPVERGDQNRWSLHGHDKTASSA
jgi:hypothetical protein